MKKISIGLTMLMITLIINGCGLDQTLKVGVERSFAPFSYVEGGQEQGFDVELWEKVAKHAGLKYEYVPMSASEMLDAVEEGEIDVALAGVSIKNDRKASLDFATAYYDTGLVLVVREDDNTISSVEDLEGKTVSTKLGSSGYDFVRSLSGLNVVTAYPDIMDAYDALMNQQSDAVVFDKENAEYVLEHEGKGKLRIVGEELTNEQYGIALKKRSRYAGRINNALREFAKDGTYEQLYEKWFEEKPESLPGGV